VHRGGEEAGGFGPVRPGVRVRFRSFVTQRDAGSMRSALRAGTETSAAMTKRIAIDGPARAPIPFALTP
jgi:hypothetical protein